MIDFISSSLRITSVAEYSSAKRDTAAQKDAGEAKEKENSSTTNTEAAPPATDKTDAKNRKEIEALNQLKQRDREVRAHESAHIAAGGTLVRGGASFQYQRGSDGQMYAVGGEVSINISKNPADPEGTAAKMRQVIRAALAPADPSSQDRMVAAEASQVEAEMQMALIQIRMNAATAQYHKTAKGEIRNTSATVASANQANTYSNQIVNAIG